MSNTIHFVGYELKRFLRSINGYILLLTGTLPIIIMLTFTAQKYVINSLIYDLTSLKSTILSGFVFFSYIVIIFFCILLCNYLIVSENAYEWLCVTMSRKHILFAKLIVSFVLISILIVECIVSFILILYSYNIPLVLLEDITSSVFLLYFLSFFVLSLSVLSNVIAIRVNVPSLANYLVIFLFFVIPFIIYFSYFQLGLFDQQMLDFSLHTPVQNIVFYFLVDTSMIEDLTGVEFQNSVVFILIVSIFSLISSFLLFSSSSLDK